MDFAISISGFVALYVFMLAAFAGWGDHPAHPAILSTPLIFQLEFRPTALSSSAEFRLPGRPTRCWNRRFDFSRSYFADGNAAGGYAVTRRMLDMFQTSR